MKRAVYILASSILIAAILWLVGSFNRNNDEQRARELARAYFLRINHLGSEEPLMIEREPDAELDLITNSPRLHPALFIFGLSNCGYRSELISLTFSSCRGDIQAYIAVYKTKVYPLAGFKDSIKSYADLIRDFSMTISDPEYAISHVLIYERIVMKDADHIIKSDLQLNRLMEEHYYFDDPKHSILKSLQQTHTWWNKQYREHADVNWKMGLVKCPEGTQISFMALMLERTHDPRLRRITFLVHTSGIIEQVASAGERSQENCTVQDGSILGKPGKPGTSMLSRSQRNTETPVHFGSSEALLW